MMPVYKTLTLFSISMLAQKVAALAVLFAYGCIQTRSGTMHVSLKLTCKHLTLGWLLYTQHAIESFCRCHKLVRNFLNHCGLFEIQRVTP